MKLSLDLTTLKFTLPVSIQVIKHHLNVKYAIKPSPKKGTLSSTIQVLSVKANQHPNMYVY